MKTKHVGLNCRRLPANPRERVFAEKWAEQAPTTLGYIICGQDRRNHDYSQRDADVAASIIQWLGTPVGNSFVDECLREADSLASPTGGK